MRRSWCGCRWSNATQGQEQDIRKQDRRQHGGGCGCWWLPVVAMGGLRLYRQLCCGYNEYGVLPRILRLLMIASVNAVCTWPTLFRKVPSLHIRPIIWRRREGPCLMADWVRQRGGLKDHGHGASRGAVLGTEGLAIGSEHGPNGPNSWCAARICIFGPFPHVAASFPFLLSKPRRGICEL